MKLRAAALVLAAAIALAAPSAAQTAAPSPSPLPTPVAFSAQAHANVVVTTQSGTFDGTATLGVTQRTGLLRIDVISVKSESLPLPPVTATIVLDRRANTFTVWSDATKKYLTRPFLPHAAPSGSPNPSPKPGTSRAAAGTSPFAKLDVLEMSIKLTGHTSTAGLATTGLAFDMQVRKKGDAAASHVTATTQLADDYLAFPVSIDAAVEPGASGFGAKLAYAVDQFTRSVPPATQFTVPKGYTQARSLFEVVLPQHQPVNAVPGSSPSPRP